MPEITIPPGVVKTISEATAVGRFIDTDKVRFYNNKPQKIGGWAKINKTQLIGIPRSLYAYAQANRREIKIAGTESHLYSIDSGNVVTDITPVAYLQAVDPAVALSTTAGSSTVTVTDPGHGAVVGDRVFIGPGTTPVGGITIVKDYVVVSVIDADHFTVTDDQVATSTATVAGTNYVSYYIPTGPANTSEGKGYGVGPYGIDDVGEAYGTPRVQTGNSVPPRYWSLDNYGTFGLFAYQGGLVYMWDDETQNRPVAMPGSPTDVIYAFVTPERFIFVLCDGMKIRWPDRDTLDWVPTAENTANVRTLATGSHLIAGCRLSGVSLIFSDTSVYSAQYTGDNSVYATELIGTNCGLVGPGAFAHEGGAAYWFGCASFHMYAGQIQPIPNQENILAWVLDNIDSTQRVKTTCWYNPIYREIWWTFPGINSLEPNLYVAVSLADFEWFHGTLARCGGTQQSQKGRFPILAAADGWVYEHDLVHDANADGQPMDWHYQVGLWRIPEAKVSVDIFGFAPDFEKQVGSIALDVQARDRPQSTAIDNEVAQLTPNTEMSDLRVAGRYFAYRLSQTGILDGDFRDGTHILEVQGAGSRR